MMRFIRVSVRLLACLGAVMALTVVMSAVASARVRTTAKTAQSTVPCAAGTNVTINSGPICGITVNGVNEWLGIPYAAPPVGVLRWEPPHSPAPWTTTLQATQFGSECAQYF